MDTINNKLIDKETKEGIWRLFDLFIDDPNADSFTFKFFEKNFERIWRKYER